MGGAKAESLLLLTISGVSVMRNIGVRDKDEDAGCQLHL